jgi:hypothetical protein
MRCHNKCEAIVKRFQSDCRAIDERLQSDRRAIAEQLRIYCRAIAGRFQSDYSAVAKQLQSKGCRAIAGIVERLQSDNNASAKRIRSHSECEAITKCLQASTKRLQSDFGTVAEAIAGNCRAFAERLQYDATANAK